MTRMTRMTLVPFGQVRAYSQVVVDVQGNGGGLVDLGYLAVQGLGLG